MFGLATFISALRPSQGWVYWHAPLRVGEGGMQWQMPFHPSLRLQKLSIISRERPFLDDKLPGSSKQPWLDSAVGQVRPWWNHFFRLSLSEENRYLFISISRKGNTTALFCRKKKLTVFTLLTSQFRHLPPLATVHPLTSLLTMKA